MEMNSTIKENIEGMRRFIEQMDEQLQVEILVSGFSKILNSLFPCETQLKILQNF
jgi:hypothetical protein